MLYEEIAYAVRGALYEVYNTLGPGFKEQIYHNALVKELTLRGISFREKKRLIITYKGEAVGVYEPDFIIEEKVLVEIKSMPSLPRLSEKQLYFYLRGAPYKLGFLVNFGGETLEIRRRIYDSARIQKVNPRESTLVSTGIRVPT